MQRRLIILTGLLAALLLSAAVGAQADPGDSSDVFIADLAGDHEVPPLASEGTGFASLTISGDETSVDFRLYVEGLDDVTQAHIHLGGADENGQVVAFLFGFADPAVVADGLLAEGTIVQADLIAGGAFDGTMAAFLDEIRSGNAYVNVHTVTQPPGEIRGQLRAAPRTMTASLSGDAQVPALASDGSGFATFHANATESEVDYRLYVNDLDDVTQAHIHLAGPDANGPVVVFLFGFADPSVASDGLLAEGTLTEADLIAGGDFDGSMGQLLDQLRSGNAYVNVHTEANPPGEIRGQIGPAAFNFAATLSGDSQVPPLESSGSGVAAMRANDAQTTLDFVLIGYGLDDVTQAHIHLAAPGENGSVVAFLFGFADPAVVADGIIAEGTLTEGDLIVVDGFDGSMAQLLDRLRAGTAYVNVHTVANPPGEIRGQIEGLARPTEQHGLFTDDDGSVHEADINTIAAAGITLGCNPPANDQYCGGDNLTRGQAAAFLFRALGLQPSAVDFFTDDDGTLFETEINGIAAVGITLGCNPPANDNYCPDDNVTRAQWASFLVRALGLEAGAGDDLFTDDDGSVHEPDIDVLGTSGITFGCNPPANDNYCPDDLLTRAQTASFLTRSFGWHGLTP